MSSFLRKFLAIVVVVFWSREVFEFTSAELSQPRGHFLMVCVALVFVLLVAEYVHAIRPTGEPLGYNRARVLAVFAVSGLVALWIGTFVYPLTVNAYLVTALSIVVGSIAQLVTIRGRGTGEPSAA